MNQSMAAKVRQYGAVAKSESASANAELVDSALKLKSDQIMADMNKNVQAQTVMTGGGVAGGKGGPQKLEEDRLVTMPDGKTYYAPTPKVAEAHRRTTLLLQRQSSFGTTRSRSTHCLTSTLNWKASTQSCLTLRRM